MTVRSATMLVAILVVALAPYGAAQGEDELAAIRELRLEGALAEARTLAERRLAAGGLDPELQIDFRLELARIHNRIGLHQNSRRVAAALQQIEAAAAVTADPAPLAQAEIELARADYCYRAEMREREFPMATIHADRAIELYRGVGDKHGEADAVHRRGLIHIQRGDYEQARELFDRSLELDRAAATLIFVPSRSISTIVEVMKHLSPTTNCRLHPTSTPSLRSSSTPESSRIRLSRGNAGHPG
jgi:tetratricopeptide (TPR) repeat protein